jgi:hypothetical protein
VLLHEEDERGHDLSHADEMRNAFGTLWQRVEHARQLRFGQSQILEG